MLSGTWPLWPSNILQKRQAYEPTYKLSCHCPTCAQLHYETKPRSPVDDPSLKNVIVILIKDVSSILSDEEISRLHYISKLFNEMIIDVLQLRILDFSPLLKTGLGYVTQESISQIHVDLATAGMIHYGLHPGMLIHYLKGEYTGKNRNVARIIARLSPYISKDDAIHVK